MTLWSILWMNVHTCMCVGVCAHPYGYMNVGMIVPVWESMCVICPFTELHGCGCACVSMFIWLHICGYDCTSIWAYVCIIYVHTVACLNVGACMWLLYMFIWLYTCGAYMCVRSFICSCGFLCVCMWLCVCSFIWLHIQGSLLNKSFPIILAWLVVKPRWSATLHFPMLGLQALH